MYFAVFTNNTWFYLLWFPVIAKEYPGVDPGRGCVHTVRTTISCIAPLRMRAIMSCYSIPRFECAKPK